ncbi:ypt/rab GTPase activating protein [Moesziomyces antarcticus T-34]|uniref:Ypt/rab GTPase activating protein n=1 Tax=Pseudozyma antarctica (strain T-34) TaxID=1151754 RepID=M9MHV2_PSEA3|nr:ypt/rab GTPase activating protein [Moesziomyces antarcticus T-34]
MASPVRTPDLAKAHPLFSGESPTKSPGPSSLVNRPIWGQRKAAQVDYSADAPSALQRRSVSRNPSFHDSTSATPSSTSLRPVSADGDIFSSQSSTSSTLPASCDADTSHITSYIPRTSRVSSYDLQFDDADEPDIPNDSLFGAPEPSSPRLFDRELKAPRATRPATVYHAIPQQVSPDQTPMPKHQSHRPSSRSGLRDGALSPSHGRSRRSPAPSTSRSGVSPANAGSRVNELARELEFPVDWLQQLHRLADADLEAALAGPLAHRPLTNQQPRESTPVKSSASAERRNDARSLPYHLQLTKALSRALAEANKQLDQLRISAAEERAQHAQTLENTQQRTESREAAFTALCLDHGIKQGEIDRSLLRAPVLDAEVLKRRRLAEQQRNLAQEAASAQAPSKPADMALPDSLQEAMLEDLEGVANTSQRPRSPSLKPSSIHSAIDASPSNRRSPSLRSHVSTTSTDGANPQRQRGKSLSLSISSARDKDVDQVSIKSSAGVTADSLGTSPILRQHPSALRGSPQRSASPHSLHKPKSPHVASPRARSTSSSTSVGGGLGDWASGLLPWSGGGASRKAAPSTAQSMVKATSPGRREMAQSAAASAADAKRSVSASKGSKAASSSTFARAFGRYTRSSPTPEPAPAAPQPNVTRLPDTYQFDRRGGDTAEFLSAAGGSAVLGAPSPRPPSAAVELEPILPNDAAPPTLIRRRKKGRKSGSSSVAGLGITSSTSGDLSDKLNGKDAAAAGKVVASRATQSSADAAPSPARRDRAARLSTLNEEDSSGDEFEVYGGKAPVPGFAASGLEAKPADEDTSVIIRPAAGDESDADSEMEEEFELLTDRYGFIYNPTDADIRLLRQARKASAPAPATLTGIKVGIRARGGTDSQSEDDKNDPDLDMEDSDEDDDARLAHPIDAQNGTGVEEQTSSQNKALSATNTAGSGTEGTASDGGGSTDSTGAKSRDKRRSQLLSVSDSKPVRAEVLPVSAVSQPVRSASPTKRRGTRSAASSRSSSPVKGQAPGFGTPRAGLPSISNTVRRLLTQLKDMHDTQQVEQKQRWDGFLERRRARLKPSSSEANGLGGAAGGAGVGGVAVAKSTSTSKTKALFAGGLFGAAHADGSEAAGSAEKAPEEDWSSGMVGVSRMGDSKSGKEDWRDFLALCQAGIPLCYRARIWAECSGANDLAEPGRYQELLSEHQGETNECLTQIDLDVHRTMPTNIYFGGDGQGVAKLRRLLVAFSWYKPSTGYCQGMNNLAATLLLTHATEEEAFWVLVCLIEKILPSEYYTSHLLVSQADQRVLIELVREHMPALHAHIDELGVDLPAITFAWFLSLYTDCLPVETLFRVWDVMFVEGMVILFRVAMAILKLHERELLATSSASSFYGLAHSLTSRLFGVDKLIHLACTELKSTIRYANILEKRERHVADLTSELGLDLTTNA